MLSGQSAHTLEIKNSLIHNIEYYNNISTDIFHSILLERKIKNLVYNEKKFFIQDLLLKFKTKDLSIFFLKIVGMFFKKSARVSINQCILKEKEFNF